MGAERTYHNVNMLTICKSLNNITIHYDTGEYFNTKTPSQTHNIHQNKVWVYHKKNKII